MREFQSEDIALFDIDGTLGDYERAIRIDLAIISSPKDEPYIEFGNNPIWIENRIRLIRNQPGWWERLEKLKAGFDILQVAQELEFTIQILTKGPRSSPNAWTEKANWSRKYIPDALVTITDDKQGVYGKVLVDDYPGYVEPWLQHRPRGLVIMPAHSYNERFQHPNLVRYDGTNLEQVREAMAIAKFRKPNEPLRIR